MQCYIPFSYFVGFCWIYVVKLASNNGTVFGKARIYRWAYTMLLQQEVMSVLEFRGAIGRKSRHYFEGNDHLWNGHRCHSARIIRWYNSWCNQFLCEGANFCITTSTNVINRKHFHCLSIELFWSLRRWHPWNYVQWRSTNRLKFNVPVFIESEFTQTIASCWVDTGRTFYIYWIIVISHLMDIRLVTYIDHDIFFIASNDMYGNRLAPWLTALVLDEQILIGCWVLDIDKLTRWCGIGPGDASLPSCRLSNRWRPRVCEGVWKCG